MQPNLVRRVASEFIGSAFLLAAIIGSGIMGERLSGGNAGLTLLANSVAVGAALVCLILAFARVSGAHFNPVVTLVDALLGRFRWREVPVYAAAQIAGAFLGVGLANLMFDLPVFFASEKVRTGGSQLLSEFIAAFGLVVVIYGTIRNSAKAVPAAVACYITAAFWFTASTSFANPAVTLARSMSNTFAGIRPADVGGFIAAQLVGALAAAAIVKWIFLRMMTNKQRVLILCTGNSARSQMAEGLLRSIAGDRFDVESAGVAPSRVRPEAIDVMDEIGIDISGHGSKSIDEFADQHFDHIITVCDNAKETCPVFPGKANQTHQNFEDPPLEGEAGREETLAIFRRVRDEIREFLIEFAQKN